MKWSYRYHLRLYFRNSIWILPVLGIAAALLAVQGLHLIEEQLGWKAGFDPSATLSLFGTLAGSMLTFIVFLSSSLLLVVQLASAQLSPRIIGVVFRDVATRSTMVLFTFTFAFTLGVLLRIRDFVPAITAYTAAYLCLLCVGVFFYLIDHVGKMLRPSGALRIVARGGHEVIRSTYPRLLAGPAAAMPAAFKALAGEPYATIASAKNGVLLAFDFAGLVGLAREAGCVVELVPQVGDFVAVGSPLFRIFGGGGPPSEALCHSLALGQERTMEQDPAFAFRIMVDIASKALSPAINDPTTAVLALDQIHYLLRSVGERHLDEGLAFDAEGSLRLVYGTPDWEDYVCLAVTEIRQFGGTSIQVVRRLNAMLENLVEVLPPERVRLLKGEMVLLQRFTERSFQDPEDQARANVSDLQGMGGNHLGSKAQSRDR